MNQSVIELTVIYFLLSQILDTKPERSFFNIRKNIKEVPYKLKKVECFRFYQKYIINQKICFLDFWFYQKTVYNLMIFENKREKLKTAHWRIISSFNSVPGTLFSLIVEWVIQRFQYYWWIKSNDSN